MSDLIANYYSSCLKADLRSGLRDIQKKRKPHAKKEIRFKLKVTRRFIEKNERFTIQTEDSLVKALIQTYRTYYRDALLSPQRVKDLDKNLDFTLLEIAKRENLKIGPPKTRNNIEKALQAEIKRRGYHSLFGTVSPFRSLLVWKKQSQKIFSVRLPEKKQKVKVIFMEDFLELSWLHYATFGKHYVGGWASKNALYCVKQAYKIDSPHFKVHYLAHEAQHFADYKQFPNLQQTDLEYRAKLTELLLSPKPLKFIAKLKMESENNRKMPHCFSAYRILQGLGNAYSTKQTHKSALT